MKLLRFSWCIVLALLLMAGLSAQATDSCVANPLGDRDLYLRGGFNNWQAREAYRFNWFCNRYELITELHGDQIFKLGDDAWSADADYGGTPTKLLPKGPEIKGHFTGWHRFVVAVPAQGQPMTLRINACPVAPLGDTVLYLRGSLNNWATLDKYAFKYRCDGYYLNVDLQGLHEFRLTDGGQKLALAGQGELLQAAQAQPLLRGGNGNLRFNFAGEHTIKLTFNGEQPVLSIGPKSYADAVVSAVNDPVALSVRHDSRAASDKAPFGAVKADTVVNFGLSAMAGVESATLVIEKRRLEGNQEVLDYTEVARIPLKKSAAGKQQRWQGSYRFKDVSIYGYYFELKIAGKTYAYQNNRQSVYWTREGGTNGVGLIAAMPSNRASLRRFRHTVYAADFKVPDWAADVVYYYIFPDRFRNGDTANDPKPGVNRYHDQTVEFHANWLDKPSKPGTGDGSDAVYNNDFFGGDLAGIIEKLDYIKSLGANTIYMTPIFQAASNHKYDTADYTRIDPAFGSNADFDKLVAEAAKRGMRVLPDASFNHTGRDSVYFDRFAQHPGIGAFEGGKIRSDSPYASWYRFDATQTDLDKQYQGWVGVSDLPELNKASPAYRAFAFGVPDGITQQWLDRGAAGWRMDVAPWVPDDFWREWRKAVKAKRPDAITVAETWFDSSKYFLGDMFDSTMNYVFRNTVLDYAAGGKASELYANLEYLREVYPKPALHALMNLLSSHDVPRSLHVLGYHDDGNIEKLALAKARYRLALFFQMTYPGSPAIYYGDEVGVTGGEDPFNRATYPWTDRGGKPDMAMLAEVRRLTSLRQALPILRHGELGPAMLTNDHVIVLPRALGAQRALVISNNASVEQNFTVQLPEDWVNLIFRDAEHGTVFSVQQGRLALSLQPYAGRVLIGE
ncbi:glycoside hydrolase family 13 protein [Chitinimonas sp. BJYL2]|uniref:glycoside hydrolase family 13 protein n=1 Tax=Chitinimonas sp. BJYL2 TaxID=2976696 RepID=UPI0022B57A86|nr:glycoside hydrolase family 13 protein [Chitinimonas sp. BJYL2]